MASVSRSQKTVRRFGLLTLIKICYVACLTLAVLLLSLVAIVAFATQGRLSTNRSLTDLEAIGYIVAICVFWPPIFGAMLGGAAWLGFRIKATFSNTSIEVMSDETAQQDATAATPLISPKS